MKTSMPQIILINLNTYSLLISIFISTMMIILDSLNSNLYLRMMITIQVIITYFIK